jgi:hypothetical protein
MSLSDMSSQCRMGRAVCSQLFLWVQGPENPMLQMENKLH